MAHDDPNKTLDELLDPGATLMVGTDVASALEFRPMTVARVRGSRIEMLLDTNEAWVAALHDGDRAEVTFSDNRANSWVSLHGVATTTEDAMLIDELWSPFADAYFEHGRSTPGIAVLRIDGTSGRYWSGPSGGRLGSMISFIKAKLGGPERSGEHGDVAL